MTALGRRTRKIDSDGIESHLLKSLDLFAEAGTEAQAACARREEGLQVREPSGKLADSAGPILAELQAPLGLRGLLALMGKVGIV